MSDCSSKSLGALLSPVAIPSVACGLQISQGREKEREWRKMGGRFLRAGPRYYPMLPWKEQSKVLDATWPHYALRRKRFDDLLCGTGHTCLWKYCLEVYMPSEQASMLTDSK